MRIRGGEHCAFWQVRPHVCCDVLISIHSSSTVGGSNDGQDQVFTSFMHFSYRLAQRGGKHTHSALPSPRPLFVAVREITAYAVVISDMCNSELYLIVKLGRSSHVYVAQSGRWITVCV